MTNDPDIRAAVLVLAGLQYELICATEALSKLLPCSVLNGQSFARLCSLLDAEADALRTLECATNPGNAPHAGRWLQ